VNKAGPLIAKEAQHYAATDDQRGQVQAFATATTQPSVTAKKLAPLWSPVEGWYVPAFTADAALDADRKRLRQEDVNLLDKLLRDEAARPFGGW
jgi:hypothetical protein